jgi:D-alanyl-D-alanine carboxypeptidase
MSYSEPARTTPRRIPRILVAGLLVVIAAIAAAPAYQLLASSSSGPSLIDVLRSERSPGGGALSMPWGAPIGRDGMDPARALEAPPRDHRAHRGALGEAHGAVPDGTTVFDDGFPGIANLDPALLKALRRAATDAAKDGVKFFVTSGWRSPEYQEQLFREAVSKYGSVKEAARWVASPNTSAHVSGDAVDIGPTVAAAWLSKHGAEYGLCQVYKNEPWHYELRPIAIDDGCPPMYADPTHDPRTQQ